MPSTEFLPMNRTLTKQYPGKKATNINPKMYRK
jgi:hypothetical protein